MKWILPLLFALSLAVAQPMPPVVKRAPAKKISKPVVTKGASPLMVRSSLTFTAPSLWLVWGPHQIGLQWDADTVTNDARVIGYRVWRGTNSRSYDTVTLFGRVNGVRVSFVGGVTNYYAVTARNIYGESDPSGEVTYNGGNASGIDALISRTAPTNAPSGVFVVESKSALNQPWVPTGRFTNSFYRLTATTGFYRVGETR